MVLRVVADLGVARELDLAGAVLDLAGHHSQESGLAGAVHADDADALAAPHGEIDVFEHHALAVGLRELLHADRLGAHAVGGRELDPHHAALGVRLDPLHLVELLDPALHRLGFVCLSAEAVYEALGLLALAGRFLALFSR